MFKVGDIIVGNGTPRYLVTTNEAIMCVTEVKDNRVLVKVLSHANKKYQSSIGHEFFVFSEYFVLAKPKFRGNS